MKNMSRDQRRLRQNLNSLYFNANFAGILCRALYLIKINVCKSPFFAWNQFVDRDFVEQFQFEDILTTMICSENIPPLTKLYPKVCNCVIMWSCTLPLELTEEIKEYMVVRNFQYETYILCNKGFCEKLGWISWTNNS